MLNSFQNFYFNLMPIPFLNFKKYRNSTLTLRIPTFEEDVKEKFQRNDKHTAVVESILNSVSVTVMALSCLKRFINGNVI
jgi:hypothetical protein